jgi:zinc/manganese transport system permease protein
LPSGPTIILVAGACYLASILVGIRGGLLHRYFPRAHYHTPMGEQR